MIEDVYACMIRPGVHVQVDESKFCVTKYGKGRRVKGDWVLGGVETLTGKMFLAGIS